MILSDTTVECTRLLQDDSPKTHDKPLTLNRVSVALSEWDLPFSDAPYPVTAQAVFQCLAREAAICGDHWISVSYNRNHYTGRQQKYEGILYTHSAVTKTIDWLAREKFIILNKSAKGLQSKGRQSTCKLADAYCPRAFEIYKRGQKAKKISTLQLRDENKKSIPFAVTKIQRSMKEEMEAINAFQNSFVVTIPECTVDDYVILDAVKGSVGRRFIDTRDVEMERIFNVDWSNCGRLYGHWVQSYLKRDERLNLLIDNEPTDEVDYKTLHIRMAYAESGIVYDEDDAYDVEGYDRYAVKIATNILINASTELSAAKALCYEAEVEKHKANSKSGTWQFCGASRENLTEAKRLFSAIKKRHHQIAKYFHSGKGSKLQKRDSDIMVRVLLRLAKLGIPSIPIHDSVICKFADRDVISDVMHDEFEREFGGQKHPDQLIDFKGKSNDRSYITLGAGRSSIVFFFGSNFTFPFSVTNTLGRNA